MKKNNILKYLFLVSVIFAFVACEDIPNRGASPVMSPDCSEVYFDENYIVSAEYDPEDPTVMELNIARKKATSAIEVAIRVLENEDNVFSVPEVVTFLAGEATAKISINFPTAELGTTYRLSIALEGEDVDVYSENNSHLLAQVTRVKWEPIDSVIFIDGIITTFFGVPYPTASYADAALAIFPDGSQRVRITNPYNQLAEGEDEYGIYDAWPYNDPEDIIDKEVNMLIDIDGNKASMQNTLLGIDWGYGEFGTGSVSAATGKVVYDDESLSYIEFEEKTLYCSMADYNGGNGTSTPNSTYIFFSVEAFEEFYSED